MIGKMALSMAGHDRGTCYLVLKQDKNTVWLADGRIRGVLNPKKKNCKHIQICGKVFTENEIQLFFENPAWADNMIREKADQIYKIRKEA